MSDPTTVCIVGTVTRFDLKYAPSGVAIGEFGVAVNERVKNKQTGQWEDGDASFFDCTVFNQMAENAAESIQQGTRVIVRGRLKMDSWEDRETGKKRTKVKVIVDDLGPELRFATAQVQKITRSDSTQGGGYQPQAPAASDNPYA